jgi:hypothetical protein
MYSWDSGVSVVIRLIVPFNAMCSFVVLADLADHNLRNLRW